MKSKKTDSQKCCPDQSCNCHHRKSADNGAIYGLGVIGSLFYFLSHATSFVTVLIGIGKSIFWPAVLIFKIFTDLGI